MRLYYSPGACPLSPHIVSKEAGLDVEISRVTFNDDGTRTTEQGEDYFKVNPKGGYVPALRISETEVLTEGVAIVQYLADQAPEKKLTPEKGTMAYYEMLEMLTFISSELHKGFSPLMQRDTSGVDKAPIITKLQKRIAYMETILSKKEYLLGEFSIADAYFYTIMRWAPRGPIMLSEYPGVSKFMKTMEAREAVAAALSEEGLAAFTQ
jgi:glutathione S-transferase